MQALKKAMKGFKGFDASICKTHLKLCVSRTKAQQTKASSQIKVLEREVGQFLKDHQEAKARIKAEQLQQVKNLDQALDLLLIWCDLVATRIKFVDREKLCPPDMIGTIHSIVYCQGRVEVKELDEVREQFEAKYGDEWIRLAHANMTSDVNPQLVMLLSVQPPKRWEVTQILVDIADKFRLDWKPPADEAPNPAAAMAPGMAPANLGMMADQPGYGAPAYGAPGAPAYGAPGAPAYGAPGAPAYGAPGAPAHGAPGAPSYGAPGAPSYGAPGAPSYGAPAYRAPSTGPVEGTPLLPMATPVEPAPSFSHGPKYPSIGVVPQDQPGAGSAPSAPALQAPEGGVIQYPPSTQTPHPAKRSADNLWSSVFGWLLRVSDSNVDDRAKTDHYLRNAHFVALVFFEPGVLASDRILPVVQDALGRLRAHQCEVIGVHAGEECRDSDFAGLPFATLLVEEAKRLLLWEEYCSQGARLGDIVLIDSNGHNVTTEAAKFLTQDPQLVHFPWRFGVSESSQPIEMARNRSPQPAPATAAPENEYDDLLSRFEALKTG
eukprot:GEMP01013173.1.p1 GENE.GEMP01013173.1~~GEMP01013173.1.p1  ORF type:complete len:548 (+),score=124.02 GEMP01013173.1:56-1699(+)